MTQLLPEGFRDRLPPFAGRAFDGLAAMVTVMQRHGYALVQPPMAEFEASLDARKGGSLPPNRLRLTDPVSARDAWFAGRYGRCKWGALRRRGWPIARGPCACPMPDQC